MIPNDMAIKQSSGQNLNMSTLGVRPQQRCFSSANANSS